MCPGIAGNFLGGVSVRENQNTLSPSHSSSGPWKHSLTQKRWGVEAEGCGGLREPLEADTLPESTSPGAQGPMFVVRELRSLQALQF